MSLSNEQSDGPIGDFASVREDFRKAYLEKLRERGKKSRVKRKHQLIGLELSALLNDPAHKSLYMKMAKEMDETSLLALAKGVKERSHVERRGAYFMRLLHPAKPEKPKKVKAAARNPKR